MSKNILAYLAGFFDGEGSISIGLSRKGKLRYSQYCLSCYVKTAGSYMPYLFQFHFGGSIKKYKLHNEKWHDYWSWQIASRKAMAFLEIICPYLILKKPQAELAIEFQKRIIANRFGVSKQLTDEEIAIREAQRILMKELKKQSYDSNWVYRGAK